MITDSGGVRRLRAKESFFDGLSSSWHRENRLTSRERELVLSALLPGELSRSGPILDLGGGTGRLVEFLRPLTDTRLLVFDLSGRMLSQSPPVPFLRVQGDAHYLPLRDRSVGLIICYCAFPHFDRKEMVIRECQRILRPGGGLVILHSCGREDINRFHSAQQEVIAGDLLPPLPTFRSWGIASGMIPERLQNSRECFLVRYRNPVP